MKLPDRSDLLLLTEPRDGPCVSLFLPTQPHGAALQEDQARLRILLGQAAARLGERDAERILAPLRTLADEAAFRTSRKQGLAIFAASGFQRVLPLPHPLSEHVGIGPVFEVGRLLPTLQHDGTFHVLAVSRNGARLLRCSRSTADRVSLPDVPGTLAEALAADSPERSVQSHSGSGPAAKGTPIYHGQGSSKDAEADRLRRWLLVVANGAARAIGPNAGPVVAAIVADQLPVLRDLGRIPRLLPTAVQGCPDRVPDAELRDRAWPLVEPEFRTALLRRLHEYWREASGGRVAQGVDEIVAAAHEGRVDTVFVARDAHHYGRMSAAEDLPDAVLEPRDESEVDLLELAITETIRKGGQAYSVDPDDVPDRAEAAALLRY